MGNLAAQTLERRTRNIVHHRADLSRPSAHPLYCERDVCWHRQPVKGALAETGEVESSFAQCFSRRATGSDDESAKNIALDDHRATFGESRKLVRVLAVWSAADDDNVVSTVFRHI